MRVQMTCIAGAIALACGDPNVGEPTIIHPEPIAEIEAPDESGAPGPTSVAIPGAQPQVKATGPNERGLFEHLSTPGAASQAPILGGGLVIDPDGRFAVIADSGSHEIVVVSLPNMETTARIQTANAEPWRVVLHDDLAYVSLRRGGAVAKVDPVGGRVVGYIPVCGAPRGLAIGLDDLLRVACAGGELVVADINTGEVLRRDRLEPDLRDVVLLDGKVFVSTFRDPQVLRIADGEVVDRWRPAVRPATDVCPAAIPTVAWRTIAVEGKVMMLHQRAKTNLANISRTQPYYQPTPTCNIGDEPLVNAVLSTFDDDGTVDDAELPLSPLAVDVAVAGAGRVLVASRSGAVGYTIEPGPDGHIARPGPTFVPRATAVAAGGGRDYAVADSKPEPWHQEFWDRRQDQRGHSQSWLLAQTDGFNHARLVLRTEQHTDMGHEVFHRPSGFQIACASCHPEGSDDGQVWIFPGDLLRRTQHLRGGLIGTQPFHWAGELPTMEALMRDVMVGRMGHSQELTAFDSELLYWLDGLPAVRVSPGADAPTIERGRAHYVASGCAGCHGMQGELPLGESFDVGTGGELQVPPLAGIAARPPYLHNGCAPTLRDRFGDCGGQDQHGQTSHLTEAELDDLIAYLRTL